MKLSFAFLFISILAFSNSQPPWKRGNFLNRGFFLRSFRARKNFDYDPSYLNFAQRFKKNHENIDEERLYRRQKNYRKHKDFFKKFCNKHFKVGENEYSDLSSEELVNMTCRTRLSHGCRSLPNIPNDLPTEETIEVPESLDYRNLSDPVISQGGCGSCWAFAVVTMLGE
jgi:C1A family cysteine protease